MLIFLCERDSQRCPQGGAERSARRIRLSEEYRAWPKRPSAPLDRRTEKYAARPLPENPALGGIPSRGGDVRRATSDERRATSDERRATSDERRATSDERSYSVGLFGSISVTIRSRSSIVANSTV